MRYLEKLLEEPVINLPGINSYAYSSNDYDAVTNIYNLYYDAHNFSSRFIDAKKNVEYSEFFGVFIDTLVKNYMTWGESVFASKTLSLQQMRYLMDWEQFRNGGLYMARLDSLLDMWNMKYNGPVANLAVISQDFQSVHNGHVEDSTNKGIRLLEKFPVPPGQKTLKEIQAAFDTLDIVGNKTMEEVKEDMEDWGSRESVMKKHLNLYRVVLRGAWAKIKSYEDVEVQKQLTKRLWEECVEAVGMCADGHVGRVVNVFCGFDKDFETPMTRMEYFQNNMALISENPHATSELKIQHAKKLMDDIGMPEEEREAWLEAF